MEADSPHHALVATALLATATGARSMTGLAALAKARSSADEHGGAARLAAVMGSMAAMEMVGDKLPSIPNRTDTGPLLGRVAAGAIIGATIGGMTNRNRTTGALVGALTALVAAELTFRFRRVLSEHMPPLLAAAVEDAVVASLAAAGVNALSRPGAAAVFPLHAGHSTADMAETMPVPAKLRPRPRA
ncbi:MAG: hypothetical protein ABI205_00655 [Gemmatimonadaceae bacterium]